MCPCLAISAPSTMAVRAVSRLRCRHRMRAQAIAPPVCQVPQAQVAARLTRGRQGG